MVSNLPPGVTVGMIPGNSPEDAAWERFLDQVYADADFLGLTAAEAEYAWKVGLAAYAKTRELGGRYPCDIDDYETGPGGTGREDSR